MYGKVKSDGLGGFSGVALSLRLGTPKNLTHNKFHVFLFSMFFTFVLSQVMYNTYCISLVLALQRSNETYKYIRCPFRRVQPMVNHNSNFTRNCIYALTFSVFLLWLSFLLLLCGDIHQNPGPDSVNLSADLSMSSSDTYSSLSNHLSIMHLNVQSILPKIDILQSEAQAYDVLVFSESWLKPEVNSDSILIEFFFATS